MANSKRCIETVLTQFERRHNNQRRHHHVIDLRKTKLRFARLLSIIISIRYVIYGCRACIVVD